MTDELIRSGDTATISWRDAEALASQYGEKAARMLTLPKPWVPPFVALSASAAEAIVRSGTRYPLIAETILELGKVTGDLIVRSSVPGETIWERGTYESIILRAINEAEITDRFSTAVAKVLSSTKGRPCALLLQAYHAPSEMGEFGNLLRISRTRDHWELSVHLDGGLFQSDRLNSQRDVAPDTRRTLSARAGLARERLFGSVGAWINNELLRGSRTRVNCEWVRSGNQFFIVQVDSEDDDVDGINPMQLYVENSVIKTALSGTVLKVADDKSRKQWDKLAVLNELFAANSSPAPCLFYLPVSEFGKLGVREALEADFTAILEKNIVVRTSVRRGAEKITNLPKTDCMTATQAAQWCHDKAKRLALDYPCTELAFVAHRYIGSRASAWVRANPADPVVEVHGTWGLPDALQFCPYDIWDVHLPTEEVTEYTNYKSDVLLLKADGSWRYERVRNDVARFQSIARDDVLSIARRTADIALRLNSACHVMWFVGAVTEKAETENIPWYWTKAHETENIERGNLQVFTVSDPNQLASLEALKSKNRRLAIALRPSKIELLRDNRFLSEVSSVTKPLGIPILLSGSTLAHAFYQLRKNGCVVISEGDRGHQRVRRQTTFGKIVRDKIPAKIASHHERQQVATIPNSAKSGFLIGKFFEEVLEAREASNDEDRRIELADVFEVWRALVEAYGDSLDKVVEEADKKREKSGGFSDGQLLLTTSLPAAGVSLSPPQRATAFELFSEAGPERTYRIPFTFFGFSELGQPRLLQFKEGEYDLELTLQRDCIEFRLCRRPEQLAFDYL